MTEIRVIPPPAIKDSAVFKSEVRKSISTIANLAGWSRDEREYLMEAVETSRLVATEWQNLTTFVGEQTDGLPVWEWNRFVRAATDGMVESFYRSTS